MLVRGVGSQILFVACLSDGLARARFLRNLCVRAVSIITGQVVIHDVANFVERRCLEDNLGLILQKIRRHIDDESLIPHFLVANDFGKDVANGRGIVSRLGRMIDDAQGDLVAGSESRHRLGELALV